MAHMYLKSNFIKLAVIFTFILTTGPAVALLQATESNAYDLEDLRLKIREQSEQLKALEKQTKALSDQQEKNGVAPTDVGEHLSLPTDTTIGGYGEISYKAYKTESSRNQADLKRFVIMVGHQFNEQLNFNSEIEWEHAIASAEDAGESEIEQAYLTYQFNTGMNLKAGLFLMPFGLLNQSHEPPTFYGVERNEVETRIIPSTWREGGLGVSGRSDFGVAWELGITTGFDLAKFDDASAPLAGSHQELQLAKAKDLAYYVALNYKDSGFLVGGALFTGNSLHSNADFKADATQPDFSGITGQVTLWDLHTRWQQNGFDFQAVYANGTIGEADKMNAVLQTYNTTNSTDRAYLPTQFYGWLVQGAYTLWKEGEKSFSPFARYEYYNTKATMPSGFSADSANADYVITLGASFKPCDGVVFKADYQKFKENTTNDRLNLGTGYMF